MSNNFFFKVVGLYKSIPCSIEEKLFKDIVLLNNSVPILKFIFCKQKLLHLQLPLILLSLLMSLSFKSVHIFSIFTIPLQSKHIP